MGSGTAGIDFDAGICFAGGVPMRDPCDIPGIDPVPGTVSPGRAPGAASRSTPRTAKIPVVEYTATRLQGTSFSTAISPATTAIHAMLITPRANSDAISAQQQPTHQAPCLTPIPTAPVGPSRQAPSRNPSGLRHFPRQTSLS